MASGKLNSPLPPTNTNTSTKIHSIVATNTVYKYLPLEIMRTSIKNKCNNEQPLSMRPSTSFSSFDPSDFDSTPASKHLSEPKVVKPSRAAGHMKTKMAAGLASLYDPVDEKKLKSPIFKHRSLEVKPGAAIIDLSTPETILLRSSKESTTFSKHWTEAEPEVMDTSASEEQGENGMDVDSAVSESSAVKVKEIRTEWIGTSQFFINQNVALQENGQFDSLILYLRAIEHDLSLNPYDPSIYLDQSRLTSKIGFTDIGTASAYRALILIQAFQNHEAELYPHVRDAFIKRLRSYSSYIIDDECRNLYLQAYRCLLNGMLGCSCFWEGLVVAKKALEVFPGDAELLEIRKWLKDGLTDRCNKLKVLSRCDPKDLVVHSRMGKLYQKPYPWMNADLYKRLPALVREVNRNFGAGNCKVRPVAFGPPSSTIKLRPKVKEHQDVGPLGIFATRDIEAGEMVLVDQCLTAISNVPSNRFEHCDACHASLKMPWLQPYEMIKPSCCNAVAFCSRGCYQTASKGYHTVVCGKDFDWLYANSGPEVSAGAGYTWQKIMFLRLISIIIAEQRAQIKKGDKPVHPLRHPLVARMTANYASPDKLYPSYLNDWQYNESVVSPTKILMQLGIDVFQNTDFSQEVIQTIYWRIENNASMSTVDLSLSAPKPSGTNPAFATHRPSEDASNKNAVPMVSLNPSYLFFNHSCDPNISWHGAVPDPWVGVDWLMGYNGEILKPGSSAMFCKAIRDIKMGEELKISYVGDPKGKGEGETEEQGVGGREGKRSWLKKWFEGGCGCELCVKENEEREEKMKVDGGEGMDLDMAEEIEG